MKKNKALPLILILTLLLFPTITGMNVNKINREPDRPPYLFSFNSYLDIEYDTTPLQDDLPLGHEVNVPIMVKYWTDVPENFMRFWPWQFRNFVLYGSMIAPMQPIELEILNVPEWATIYFTDPELLVYVPTEDEMVETCISLIIMPHYDAPAETYALQIKAEVPAVRRIGGFSHTEFLDFKPQYLPIITVDPVDDTVMTPPGQLAVLPINVTNNGNAQTRVTSEIESELEGWSAYIIPPEVIFSIDETEQMSLVLIPPEDFEGTQWIFLSFTSERYPPSVSGAVGSTYVAIMAHYIIR